MTRVLVTGGAGFIGSHTCVALAAAGCVPIVLDNFCNSDAGTIERIASLTNMPVDVCKGDVRDKDFVTHVLLNKHVDAVIHFAGLKAVAESVSDPLRYYDTNVQGSAVLAAAMQSAGVRILIFSSSATVYGEPAFSPVTEDAICRPENPYGRSKWMVEQVLHDLHVSDATWRIAILRYFNPVGAHDSGRLGEKPTGIPNNLMPLLCQVAAGQRDKLVIYGDDYPTTDGTGVRDYVHVMDLAEGHVAALKYAQHTSGLSFFNLGTGQGVSVKELIHAFELACGRRIRVEIGSRRLGDVPAYWADTRLAKQALGWMTQRDVTSMCRDSWRWQQRLSASATDR